MHEKEQMKRNLKLREFASMSFKFLCKLFSLLFSILEKDKKKIFETIHSIDVSRRLILKKCFETARGRGSLLFDFFEQAITIREQKI